MTKTVNKKRLAYAVLAPLLFAAVVVGFALALAALMLYAPWLLAIAVWALFSWAFYYDHMEE